MVGVRSNMANSEFIGAGQDTARPAPKNKAKAIMVVIFVMPIASIIIPLRKYVKTEYVCWFSSRFWNVHDYPVEFGGDGTPSHFYKYKCWNCGKEFGI